VNPGPEVLLDRALGALQPFYSEGEDGSPVRLAFDAIAGLLAKNAGTTENPNLVATLQKLKADRGLIVSVEKVYGAAQGSDYGTGLTGDQAREVNKVEEIHDELRDFVLGRIRGKQKPAKKARGSTRRKSR
jgi:hypothetical protein